jgi:hypothetical protein
MLDLGFAPQPGCVDAAEACVGARVRAAYKHAFLARVTFRATHYSSSPSSHRGALRSTATSHAALSPPLS